MMRPGNRSCRGGVGNHETTAERGPMAGRILPAVRPQKPAPQPPAPAVAPARVPNVLSWRTGDRVRWQRYTGTFLRETVDGQAELLIGARTYRVPAGELRPA